MSSWGNIWSFFALVLVLGFRAPALWALPMLTKMTPILGPVWFAARREWRSLLAPLGVAAALSAISIAAQPKLWHRWIALLLHPDSFSHSGKNSLAPLLYLHGPLVLAGELPIALGLTVYAARTDRRWLLPIAMLFASPVFTANAFVMLAAVPRLRPARDAGVP